MKLHLSAPYEPKNSTCIIVVGSFAGITNISEIILRYHISYTVGSHFQTHSCFYTFCIIVQGIII